MVAIKRLTTMAFKLDVLNLAIQPIRSIATANSVYALAILLATTIVLNLQIGAPKAMAKQTRSSMLSVLRSASSPELETVVNNYQDQRQSDVLELISIISEQKETLEKDRKIPNKSKEWFAVVLLGELRAVEAAPLLARLIAARDSSFSLSSDEDNPHWYSFPAAVALSKIGMPAVEYLMELARTALPTSTAFQLSGATLEAILGEELALSAVKQYARHHPELSQKDRFTALTTLLQTGHKRWIAYNASDFSPE